MLAIRSMSSSAPLRPRARPRCPFDHQVEKLQLHYAGLHCFVNSHLQEVIVNLVRGGRRVASNDVRFRRASLPKCGFSVIVIAAQSGDSIHTGIFSRLPLAP